MVRIRQVEIKHFRSIQSLTWHPRPGLNCLIGPGDSGKSTVLDAIDLCLGARRTASFADTDFYRLDVTQPISISLTLGNLPDRLKNLDYYGDCLRGFDHQLLGVLDEPRKDCETVITVRLTVSSDLEPVWSLYSDRTAHLDPPKSLHWKDRVELTPSRLGHHPTSNLSWTRGSVLNRFGDERAVVGPALVNAAREARATFGAQAGPQLAKTLQTVTQTAKQLGIHVGATATALLDAHSASFGDGAISLHSDTGIPLRSMGTGSTRLLIAGLHRATANLTEIVLVDELEHGLEPHRINRLLDSLGAKEKEEPLQVFMTTHSPVVLRELSGSQLSIVRSEAAQHTVNTLGNGDDVQAALRSFPEAFLAKTVLVCEGASEIGLVRGLDQYWTEQGFPSLQAAGVSYIDVGGGDADRAFKRAKAFLGLGYRVAVVQDNDKPPTQAAVQGFLSLGGALFSWRDGLALEDELFLSLPAAAITALIARAQELTEDGRVNDHIGTKSNGKVKLANVLAEGASGEYSQETRRLLGVSSRIRNAGWFKSITKMSGVAHDIVAPNWERVVPEFKESVLSLIRWARANA
ncbi:hypothetical protein Cthiooxydans_46830 [Comamonas thiooxydans]|nr:hypothetical protein Cthiooxydans_46830 [Comamonas thiooxydans]